MLASRQYRLKRGAVATRVADRASYLQSRFGMSLENYESMHTSQEGLCAICRLPERLIDRRTGETRRLAVDHCHATGKVRGLLCTHCNMALGQLRDSSALLLQAIQYLEKHG